MFILIGNMCDFTLFAVIGDEAACLPFHSYSMQMIFIKVHMNTEIVSDNVCVSQVSAAASQATFLVPVGLNAKPQAEAATVAAVSRSEDAADANRVGVQLGFLTCYNKQMLKLNVADTCTRLSPSKVPITIFIHSQ